MNSDISKESLQDFSICHPERSEGSPVVEPLNSERSFAALRMTDGEGPLQFCIVIPVFRHLHPLMGVLKSLEKYALPCVVVDDGNEPALKSLIEREMGEASWISVVRLPTNQGKGVALLAGFKWALDQGFSHAICLDADGQHNDQDIPRLVTLARQNPLALILGRPVFDKSAPLSRRLGRRVSCAWVWIETLSMEIVDPLCGFRCYPLAGVRTLLKERSLGRRMDFDVEIAVRLFWQGLSIVSFETQVLYPTGGISNFQTLGDNIGLSLLHARLFFGMIRRCSQLLKRHGVKNL